MIGKLLKNPILWASVLLICMGAFVPSLAGGYTVNVFIMVFIYIVVALGWNISSGFLGYVNLGYAAFIALGAYTTAYMLNLGYHWTFAILTAGIVGGALIGLLVGLVLGRLRGVYYAITMIAFWQATRVLASSNQLAWFTGGGRGTYAPNALGQTAVMRILTVVVVFAFLFTAFLARSKLGLKMLSIRSDESAASMTGIKTWRIKNISWAISNFIGAIGGGILAIHVGYIDPVAIFNPLYILIPVVMVVFGGRGSVIGPIVGGLFLGFLKNWLWARFLALDFAILGITLIVVLYFMPQGLIPWLKENNILPRTRDW
ncbi:hypothetical protein AKJ40_02055 [candidate division MSBL1 archaeon SCGC-AAA259M10]|uniref:Branched-chain amino acid ABC transporter permease n=1 Tax=candidate division MSBL1 archaeon SCGC-AAA259M10 TaxID=1698270 RepID=A0A133V0P5_9EURY|nr:hypothetical protein AKJ40_02055 [candidate division MSBL1 archaeon SCGC-AAA259M10]